MWHHWNASTSAEGLHKLGTVEAFAGAFIRLLMRQLLGFGAKNYEPKMLC